MQHKIINLDLSQHETNLYLTGLLLRKTKFVQRASAGSPLLYRYSLTKCVFTYIYAAIDRQ